MQIIAQCPFCNHSWRCDQQFADRRIKCKNCQKLFKIPKLEEMPEAMDRINNVKGSVYIDKTGNTYG